MQESKESTALSRRRSWFADARRAASSPEVVIFRPVVSDQGLGSILAIPVSQEGFARAELGPVERFDARGRGAAAEAMLWDRCLEWIDDRPLIADSLPARLPLLEASLDRATAHAEQAFAGRLRGDDRPLVDLHETADALARRGVLRGAERAPELGLRGLATILSPALTPSDHPSATEATARIWSELLLPGLRTWAEMTTASIDESLLARGPLRGMMTHVRSDGIAIEQPIADLYVEAGYDEIGLPSVRIIAIPFRLAQNAAIAEVLLSPPGSAELSALLRGGLLAIGETEASATFVHDPYDGADTRVMRNRRLVLARAPGSGERLALTHDETGGHERITISLAADRGSLASLAARIDRARRALLD